MSALVSLIYFSSSDIAIVVFLSAFGYILSSIDLIFLVEYLIKFFTIKNSLIVPLKDENIKNNNDNKEKKRANLSIIIFKNIFYHIVMLLLVISSSIIPYMIITSSNLNLSSIIQIETTLLYICVGLFIICKILSDLNSVYIIFGLVRNPFYPISCNSLELAKNAKSIHQKKLVFVFCKYLRLFLIKIIAPLVLCAVVSIDCSINKTYQNKQQKYWRIICILRAFRWV